MITFNKTQLKKAGLYSLGVALIVPFIAGLFYIGKLSFGVTLSGSADLLVSQLKKWSNIICQRSVNVVTFEMLVLHLYFDIPLVFMMLNR